MNRRKLTYALAAVAILLGTASMAQQFGTAAEAKAMLDRAIAALKANEIAALAAFNDKNNKDYHDRDLYVFCWNMSDGKYTAHVNPALMGTDIRNLKINGDPVGAKVYAAAKEGTITTIDYDFPKPATGSERILYHSCGQRGLRRRLLQIIAVEIGADAACVGVVGVRQYRAP
jgi:cytochrome c